MEEKPLEHKALWALMTSYEIFCSRFIYAMCVFTGSQCKKCFFHVNHDQRCLRATAQNAQAATEVRKPKSGQRTGISLRRCIEVRKGPQQPKDFIYFTETASPQHSRRGTIAVIVRSVSESTQITWNRL